VVFGLSVFLGVLASRGDHSSNPVAITFTVMAIFMLVLGLWSMSWSLRTMAERMMRVASRR
jgi:hypothetical protein